MRHRRQKRHFGRPQAPRKALIHHLSRSLIQKGRIETTVPKAKEARRLTDRLIQFGIRGDRLSFRQALRVLGSAELTSFLFKEIAPLFKGRQGGYTRMLRSRVRPGDGVELAVLELVEKRIAPEKKKKEKPKKEVPLPSKDAEQPKEKIVKVEKKKERGGFFSSLRKFIKPKDRS